MAPDNPRAHQTIDAFEALIHEFRALNPQRTPDVSSGDGSGPTLPPSERDVVEAWLLTTLDLDGAGTPGRRWVRSLGDRILQRSPAGGDNACVVRESTLEADLAKRLERHPDFEPRARELADWIRSKRPHQPAMKTGPVSGPESAALARGWRSVLPGLRGGRAWRLLEHLGSPVLPPEAPVQRMMFRMGILDRWHRQTDSAGAALTSSAQELARLAGVEFPFLRLLLRWTARPQPGYRGGGWCGPKPQCAACPLATGCVWARLHPPRETASAEEGGGSAETARAITARLKTRPLDELSDAEILALVMRGGRADAGAVETASTLLHRIGELPELEKSDAAELARGRGIGPATARQIKGALELAKRISTRSLRTGSKIQGSEAVWAAFGQKFRHISQEHFIVLLLDTKNRFITHRIVSRGTLDSSAAHPREVFKEAIRASASAVILIHNHPSGDPQPSPEDRAVTRQLVEAGGILSIRVLDHIILGGDRYFSFRDSGEM